MNWDNWELAKNSLIEATKGRGLIKAFGLTFPKSEIDIFCWTVLSIFAKPTRNWF